MKKRLACILLCVLMIFMSLPASADTTGFNTRMKYGTLVPYDNLVYDYGIYVYTGFTAVSDAYLETMLLAYTGSQDRVYDLRMWNSKDSAYVMEVQVKEKTYASIEEEILHAPEYAALVNDGVEEENRITQIHDGILRDTEAGTMLEMAYYYIVNDVKCVSVYYDYYGEQAEYIFQLSSYGKEYDEVQKLLDNMVRSAKIGAENVK